MWLPLESLRGDLWGRAAVPAMGAFPLKSPYRLLRVRSLNLFPDKEDSS